MDLLSPNSKGKKAKPSSPVRRYQGQHGETAFGQTKVSFWYRPVTKTDTGSPRFPLKSLMTKGSNYGVEISGIQKYLRDKGVDAPEMETQANCEQLVRIAHALLCRRMVQPNTWSSIIATCPFKNDVALIAPDNVQEIAGYLEEFADVKQNERRKNASAREDKPEKALLGVVFYVEVGHAFCLRKHQGFVIHRTLAESGKNEWHDRLACYFATERDSVSNQYCLMHDYSCVRKSHTIGSYVFYVDDFSDPPHDPAWYELCTQPLPMQRAEGNPLKKLQGTEYMASKFTCTAMINNLITTLGVKSVDNIIRPRGLTFLTIDLDTWDPLGGAALFPTVNLRLQAHLLCDQGSPELRTLQLALHMLPGIAKEPPFHRLSNNLKNLIPEIALAAAGIKSWFCGPFGSGGNQGRLRNSQASLLKEAKNDLPAASKRKYAPAVIEAFPGENLAEILEKAPAITHGTDARWLRDRDHSENMIQVMPLLLYCLEPLIQEDMQKASNKKKPKPAREAAPPALPQEHEDRIDSEERFEGINSDFLELTAEENRMLGKEWDGSTLKLKEMLMACTREHRLAQRDLARSHSDLYDLIDAVSAKGGDDTTLLENPATLKRAQKYLGSDLTATSTLTTPELQNRLQKNRLRILQHITADIFAVLGETDAHRKCGLKLLGKVMSLAGWQLWDPIFGLWESVCERRTPFVVNSENLPSLENALSYELSIFALRAGGCLMRGRRHWLERQVKNVNECFPPSEKLQEQQFKDDRKFKDRAAGGSNMWSKQLHRYTQAEEHTRFYPAPLITRSDRTSILDPADVLADSTWNKVKEDPTTENVKWVLEDMEKKQTQENKNHSKFLTARFDDLCNSLQDAADGDLETPWPAKLQQVIEHVGDPSITTIPAHLLGVRGIEAYVILKNKDDAESADFKRTAGKNIMGLKNIQKKIQESGGVLMRKGKDGPVIWVTFAYSGLVAGHPLVRHGAPNQLRFPLLRNEIEYDADWFINWDLIEGKVDWEEDEGAAGFFIVLHVDLTKIVSSRQMYCYHFPHTSRTRQQYLLQQVTKKHPELTARMFDKMLNGTRAKIYEYFMIRGEVRSDLVQECVRRLGPQLRSFAMDGEERDDELHKEHVQRLAEKAGTESGPVQHRPHSPGKTPGSGIRRLKAQVVFNIWNLDKNPPVDEVFTPRVTKEYELPRGKFSIVRADGEWDADVEIFVGDEYDEADEQLNMMQPSLKRGAPTIAKMAKTPNKNQKDTGAPKSKKARAQEPPAEAKKFSGKK
eukprot:g8527.t1